MDIIEYKLQSNNPTLIAHGIWKLLEAVKQKVEIGEPESKITELKYLLTQCESSNGTVSVTASQALVTLAESELLTVISTISNLTACLGNAKHCGAVASAICNLLALDLKMWKSESEYVCPFSLKTPQHPLISVLMQKSDTWMDVLSNVRTMINHCKEGLVEQYVTLLRPVFLYILCNPKPCLSEICRQQAWHILNKANGTIVLQIEILQWLRTNSLESCIDTNNRILEIVEIAAAKKNTLLCSALIPFVMSLALELLKRNGDPRSNLDMISSILVYGDKDSGSILACFIAEMMAISPSVYLLDIITMARTILDKTTCNRKIAHSLIAPALQWLAYPSILSIDALDVAKEMIKEISKIPAQKNQSNKLYKENPFNHLQHVDSNVQFYVQVCNCVESLNQENMLHWLEKLSKAPPYVIYNYKIIIAGLFLESENSSIVKKTSEILVDFAKSDSQVLSLVLFKLTKTRDIEMTKNLLFTLPKLVGSKENVPIIMQTFKTFSTSRVPLNYLAIELYLKSLAVESRCIRYMQSALIELSKSDRSWLSDVTCARAMKYICENHSEHGAELVPLLSQTLNRCSDRDGSAASALALNGISALCVAGVTEICSTWKVLSPKMYDETRPIVLRALCELFGDIPHCPPQEGQIYSSFIVKILTKLWSYIFHSKDTELIESAFKALSSYKLEDMPLCILPPELIIRIKSDEKILQTPETVENKSEDLSMMIPANYWILMLENVNKATLQAAGNFLHQMIQEELYGLRTGIYRWPHGEPVNFKYLSEKSVLRELGEYVRHYKYSEDHDHERIVTECLRIFSYKYLKPLPPVQWQQLKNAIEISSETRKYGILLACHQAPISPSANEFVEQHLTKLTNDLKEGKHERLRDSLDLYGKLDDICRAVGSNVLSPFLETTLNIMMEKVNLENENAVSMFDKAMKSLGNALKDELIQNDNKSILINTLEKLMNKIDVDSKIFSSFVTAALEMTAEKVERLTLPSVWLEVTTEKLKKAIVIRAELALKKNDEAPLSWMNEVIRASVNNPAIHTWLLKEMLRILPQMRLEKSNANWTLDLMRQIGATIVDYNKKESIDAAAFLCEILFITVICLSATDCLLINDNLLVTSHDVRATLFPQAVASILQTAHWKDIIPQTMEWLNHMRTTPIRRMYKIVFHNALVSIKNERYFDVMWTKYLSIRMIQ